MKWKKISSSTTVKNLSSLFTSTFLASAITSVFWIYFATILGETEYGQLGFLVSIASISANIALIGGEYVMIVYVAKGKNVQSTLFTLSIITSSISAIILYIFFTNIGLSIYVIGFVIYFLTVSELQGKKFFGQYSKFIIIQKIAFVVFALAFSSEMGANGVMLGYALSYLLFIKNFFKSIKNFKIDFEFLKEKKSFIINNYALDLTGSVKGQIDRLLLVPLFGYALLGNYYLGLQVISVLGIIPGIMFTYLLPEESSGRDSHKLRNYTIIGSIILSVLGIFLAPILIPQVFPKYEESVSLIPIMSIGIIPSTIASMYTTKILGKEKSFSIVISYVVSTVVLVVGIFITKEFFDITGIAFTYVLANSIQAIILFFVSKNIDKGIKLNEK